MAPGRWCLTITPDNPSRRSELAWVLAAVLVAIATVAIPLSHNPLFYFQDDFQIQFMPMFGEIARLLKSGQFPLMTDRVWYGGAILGEYQFAVLNPVSLAAYIAIAAVGHLQYAAALFVLIHIAILSSGLYLLARECGADPLASLMAGVVGSTGSWLIYWAATTWIPALVGTAWIPWAMWGLLRAYRASRWTIPAALLSYMVLVSGWPYANAALIVALAITLPISLHREARIAACLRVVLAFGAGLLLAAPALFPAMAYLQVGDRIQELQNHLWRASLGDLVMGLGVPVFPSLLRVWSGAYRMVTSPPIYYLSWFVPLVLVNRLAHRSPNRLSTQTVVLWFAAAVFGVLCVSPAMWQFRYAFRFLPYYHFALVLLVAVLLTEGRQSDNSTMWRLWPTGLALLVPFFIAYADVPELWRLQAGMALSIALAALVVIWLQRRGTVVWRAFLVAGHVLLFSVLTGIITSNGLVAHWRPPLGRGEAESQRESGTRAFALYPPLRKTETRFGGSANVPRDYWVTVAPGDSALYRRMQTVNGYSAIRQRGFLKDLCLTQKGATCSTGPSTVLAVDPETKRPYLDLMGVDRVVAMRGPYSALFADRAGSAWTVVGRTGWADIFERTTPQRRIGNLVQWPDGAQIRNLKSTTRSDSYDVIANPSKGRVIVARAWYPGITARLNGRSLRVEPIDGLVPSFVLPSQAHGKLVIGYWPAGLTAGIYAALAGAIILLAFAIVAPNTRAR